MQECIAPVREICADILPERLNGRYVLLLLLQFHATNHHRYSVRLAAASQVQDETDLEIIHHTDFFGNVLEVPGMSWNRAVYQIADSFTANKPITPIRHILFH